MPLEKTFKLSEITRILRIKKHFVIHLVEMGIVKPLLDVKGRGKSRVYSYRNLIEIGIFVHLTQSALPYEIVRRVTNKLGDLLKDYPRETIETIPYISVLGLLDGRIQITAAVELFPDTLSPEDFLRKQVHDEMKEKGLKASDFSYYFIIDVKNISRSIDLNLP